MSKFWILTKQVYKEKLLSKSFISLSLLYVAIIAVVVYWDNIANLIFKEEPINISLVNETDVDITSIFTSNEDIKFSYSDDSTDELYEQLESEEIDAVVTISELNDQLKADIATYTPLQLNAQSTINSYVDYASKIYGIQSLNLTADDAEKILNSQPIITLTNLNEKMSGKSEGEKTSGLFLSYFIGIVIYFLVTTFLSMITTNVASEKGSRALEMLLVNVKPGTHFQAKITGVLLLAVTQFAIIFAAIILFLYMKDTSSTDSSNLGFVESMIGDISVSYLLYVIAFVGFTVILFLIIGALFGSLVSKVEEASQALTPAMMLLLVGFYVMLSGVANPDTLLIKVFSYIPLTSGMVMPMRIGATDISPIEPILSLGVLIATVVLGYLFSLSFYKRSVLTYSSGGIIQKIKTVFKFTTK
ncbi:ABC transporter permease [Ureibacillus acetophenoni]|uniref:ABC-2 type transport system permease protein n=1 Tax=Ureibacillus acetophenoni TaxID=614649 RepID=A0A285U618_9BACL|nr:ABC transporter permease [Ureibacillus acetophenoni]SOC37163.1 ABC-2 type transport system permease protein [Ureibacillus acetophenoni]